MRRSLAILSLILSLAVPIAAPARESLTIGLSQYPVTLNPLIESMLAKTYVLAFVHRPITAYDPSWTLVCLLCETLPTLENGLARIETLPGGKKGIAVTYALKADARWGDGTPVSSADVAFTWTVGRHPRSGVSNSELFNRITRVEILDARRFTLHFDRVTFDYNAINDLRLLPAHIERPRFEAAPESYRTQTAYEQDSTNPGLYNGPYRIAGLERGSHILLVRNPHWSGPRPGFDRIQIRTIENSAAMEAHLLSGGVDMIAGELGLPLEQALALEKRQGSRFTFITRPGLVYEHLDVNLSSPILADRRVRRALLAALDRDGLTRQLFDGRQPVAATMVPQLDWVFAEDVPAAKYDPAAASALLDEAGWRSGPGGIRVNAQGDKLALELLTTAGNRSRELVAQVIQAQWRKVGIDLKLRTEPPRVMFGDTVSQRKFPHLAMFAWYSAPESVPRSTLHSTLIPTAANNWAGQNYPGYASPKMDALLDAIEIETDRPRRKALWRDLQRLYAEDLPALPLYFRADPFILPKGMSGLSPTGHQDPSPYWVEQWRWD
ncbi:peptide ABC transporter substrate-binding protein [Magnetospirillum fulvum]|uniref:Peptide/nickel transport system substrate-binding protein n=1 Tax=Magnetospirillum fulvum TaxID=1082 RepID=A0A1H6IC82_MAGFU|nr:peptide ABC transporter substrate-binding protein [Magnetospirillum fulvum]SEH43875.1 peptide/nickel transport system substrate-binding protein [Magnetospirillum fulvum]